METINLIKKYKTEFTPMDDEANTIGYYHRNFPETGSLALESFPVQIYKWKNANIYPYFSTLNCFSTENKEREYVKLYSEFSTKWEKNRQHFNGFKKELVFESIKSVIDNFLSSEPEYITFDLTPECSVFFQSFINDKNIYFELYFTNDTEGEIEAITNIYENGNCIFAFGSSSIEYTFSKITSNISRQNWLEQTPYFTYDLSEKTFATI